jgi:hypothetical protein
MLEDSAICWPLADSAANKREREYKEHAIMAIRMPPWGRSSRLEARSAERRLKMNHELSIGDELDRRAMAVRTRQFAVAG